ncbi:NAD(P)/FAD-dependent oxidoreductase [Neorhizobium sp. NCHU2750]|uniref:FAD/NAD(P)-dependent oxidoreductase n=1 Tax=Neorhizobium sp. NCHU2750 TaxID=1825976 RepID=UPI000E74414F|nr:(2Fe-2S)-binding protein [Neorhizobium sp. NCHU2750]
MTARIAIIGAGPAGLSAARVLVDAGLRPTLIDDAMRPGGQAFRAARTGGVELASQPWRNDRQGEQKFNALVTAILPKLDYRPQTMVWSVGTDYLNLLSSAQSVCLPVRDVILATGATDRIIPFPGWTTPGVFSLGAAQIALKAQSTLIGQRVAFVGTGPLLYLVAYQYMRAGAQVVAVLDSNKPRLRARSLAALLPAAATFIEGLKFVTALRARNIPCLTGAEPIAIVADHGELKGLRYRHQGIDRSIDCDAIGTGYGLKAETQVADLLGLPFRFSRQHRQWLPERQPDAESALIRIYHAGDGSNIGGKELAALDGELAALELLAQRGHRVTRKVAAVRKKINRVSRFRQVLDEELFPFPAGLCGNVADETIVCRCERISAGEVRATVSQSDESDINRVKAFCRLGMGRCQGRLCERPAAEIIAAHNGCDISVVGRLRAQSPVKPVALSVLAKARP